MRSTNVTRPTDKIVLIYMFLYHGYCHYRDFILVLQYLQSLILVFTVLSQYSSDFIRVCSFCEFLCFESTINIISTIGHLYRHIIRDGVTCVQYFKDRGLLLADNPMTCMKAKRWCCM